MAHEKDNATLSAAGVRVEYKDGRVYVHMRGEESLQTVRVTADRAPMVIDAIEGHIATTLRGGQRPPLVPHVRPYLATVDADYERGEFAYHPR